MNSSYSGEKIFLTDENGLKIEIEVVKREEKLSNFTQLRINAPRHINIVRGEIMDSHSE
ncbi:MULTISPECIES: carbon storage regulator [Oceanobacillus]|uniref:carbon storage regulator n=1 Tax=Oceanobacillus TaxID=182709 RepID=UPI000A07DB2B|nr:MULTISPECIES: carbon storage regulator [Oceanobacillus]